MVTGNAWRDEETLHTLRMLELTGHANVPVARGAVFPLVRTEKRDTAGRAVEWQSGPGWAHGARDMTLVETAIRRACPESRRSTCASTGRISFRPCRRGAGAEADRRGRGAFSLIRQVRAHPHEVTIYAAGPMTNIALAHQHRSGGRRVHQGDRASTGGSLNPETDDPEFRPRPRHEFNFWFDPEAAHIVLRADWPRVDVTTVDVSIKAPFTADARRNSKGADARGEYIAAEWSQDRYYLWDELAACAWLIRR